MTPRVIGIGGLLRSGKDTVSDYLVEAHGWVKMGMSEPLNDALLTLNPLVPMDGGYAHYRDLHDIVGYTVAKQNEEVRRLLQMLGTEVGRNMIDENVWVNIAERRIREQNSVGKSVILTGVRYPNEIALIKRVGGELWWVNRPGIEPPAGALGGHTSETSVSAADFDRVIENDGTILDLTHTVDRALED